MLYGGNSRRLLFSSFLKEAGLECQLNGDLGIYQLAWEVF
jgi:hypothetical protein